MATHVIKKDGRRQAFSLAKLKRSVERSAKDAGLSAAKIKELLKNVVMPLAKLLKSKRAVKASALRKALLGRLERKAKSAARAWRSFEKRR